MNSQLKGIIQYSILILISVALLWLALGSIEVRENQSKLEFIVEVWMSSNKGFLILSGLLAVLSHIIRAERWKILLKPAGYNLRLDQSFVSVMIGYFVNLAIPRGGELSRCYNIYRINKTPIEISFGTVVAERVVDLIMLLSLIGFAFILEWNKFVQFFEQLNLPWDTSSFGTFEKVSYGLIAIIIIALIYFTLVKVFKGKALRFFVKFRSVFRGMKTGLLTIFSSKQKGLFLFYSLAIWILYFFMSYFIVMAFPETNNLSILDTLTIFVIGGIAMAVPLPGGTGSYHVLVPLGLVTLFGIGREESVAFSFIFHGWQTFVVIIVGIFSLLYSQYLIKRNKS